MAEQLYSDDPFGKVKEPVRQAVPDPKVVKEFHTKADTDASVLAAHHTLGIKATQASPGDHTHNGAGSRRLMDGITITGAKGGNVALANLITALASSLGFTDATT